MADGIRVETDGLNRFSGQVQDDTSRNLESGYASAKVDLPSGGQFGATNPSGSIYAAKQRYSEGLEKSTANIQRYVNAAQILAGAAAYVASSLASSDGRSAELSQALTKALADSEQAMNGPLDGHPTTRTNGSEAL